jgi:hypothetical protein
MLAEAFGEPLTDERIEIYARSLADIPQDRLNAAFQRALREQTFFPKVAELRALAASKPDDEKKVEANAAWDYVNEYLRKWGVDRLPLFSGGGKVTTPPPLDARSDYALRRIGGLRALNQVDIDKRPFMYRDFCEAYTLAPVAELMALPLQQQFGDYKLLGNVKQLTQAKSMKQIEAEQHDMPPDHLDPFNEEPASQGQVSPAPPGDNRVADHQFADKQFADRRAELKRQAEELIAQRKT